jgi:hypothetical protein
LNRNNGGPQKPAVFLPEKPLDSTDAATRATMMFGTPTQLENDPRSEIRNVWEHMPPPGGPLG